ncbi:splicing factor [Salix suchowensis]|nr:splicing factor [Salix suchowensis]
MSVKVDQTSAIDIQSIKMTAASSSSGASTTSGQKVSLFAAKSGYVIPKNKLLGSLVSIVKGGKKPGSKDAVNGQSTNQEQVQRKTKWGPDLAQDASVKRGRALAYQIRVDQIVQQLELGIPEPGRDRDSHGSHELEDPKSSIPQIHTKNSEILELEKQEAIGEILILNPSYKAPPNYKPLLKQTSVPIPVKEYPGYNFIGLIFGLRSETQKRVEKETGAKIQLHASKAHTGEKVEISPSDGNETKVAYEELSVLVTGDTFEKVDAAVVLIELLLTSVSGNLAAGDNANASQNQVASTPFTVSTAVNQGVVLSVSPQHGQFLYQNSWFPASTPLNLPPSLISPQSSSAPLLNNPMLLQSASFNSSTMPSLFGPRLAQAFSNPYQPINFPMPTPQLQSFTGQPHPTGLYSVATLPSLQPLSSGPHDGLLVPSGSSSGWSSPGPWPSAPQPGFPSNAPPPNAANMVSPVAFSVGPSSQQPHGVSTNRPTLIQSSLATPSPISGVVGAFSGTTSNFAPMRSPTITGPGDFTFHPHHLQNPASQIAARPSSHHATQNGPLPRPMMQSPTPQGPPFHFEVPNSTPQHGRQMFSRPQVSYQMGQVPFLGNPTGPSLPPAFQHFQMQVLYLPGRETPCNFSRIIQLQYSLSCHWHPLDQLHSTEVSRFMIHFLPLLCQMRLNEKGNLGDGRNPENDVL